MPFQQIKAFQIIFNISENFESCVLLDNFDWIDIGKTFPSMKE